MWFVRPTSSVCDERRLRRTQVASQRGAGDHVGGESLLPGAPVLAAQSVPATSAVAHTKVSGTEFSFPPVFVASLNLQESDCSFHRQTVVRCQGLWDSWGPTTVAVLMFYTQCMCGCKRVSRGKVPLLPPRSGHCRGTLMVLDAEAARCSC